MLRSINLIWLVVVLIVSCRSDKNPSYLRGSWVIVKGQNNTGRIWDIRKDKIIVKVLGTDYIKEHNCKITHRDDLIFEYETGEVESKKIVSSSKDSLVLMDADSTFIKLVPLLESDIDLSLEELSKQFINSSWKFISERGGFRFDFTDQHRYSDTTQPRWALSHGLENWPAKFNEIWTLDEYKGHLFLLHTNYEVEMALNMLNSFDGNKINAIGYWRDGRPFDLVLKRNQKLPDYERVNTIKQLTSGLWILNKYDTTFLQWSRGYRMDAPMLDSLLTIDDLNTNQVTYIFRSNGIYTQESRDRSIEVSRWELSDDGSFIWIGGLPTPDCIELVSIDSLKMTINRMEGILGLDSYAGSLVPPSGVSVPFYSLMQDLTLRR